MIHHRHLLVCCFISLLPFSSLFSQHLSFGHVMQIYKADSATARKLCEQNGIPLTEAGNTGSANRYRFSTTDSSQRVELSYPNDSTSLNVQMNYWFTGKTGYSSIRSGLQKAGFKRVSGNATGSTLPPNAERYIKDSLQAELIRPEGIQTSYWLFLHPKGNYNW